MQDGMDDASLSRAYIGETQSAFAARRISVGHGPGDVKDGMVWLNVRDGVTGQGREATSLEETVHRLEEAVVSTRQLLRGQLYRLLGDEAKFEEDETPPEITPPMLVRLQLLLAKVSGNDALARNLSRLV